VRVLIFDEIDIGVGGRSGEILGKKLWNLGRQHQVICITHLPQIAVFADTHFGVHKEVSGDRTLTMLQTLEGDSRIKELTAMLSGRNTRLFHLKTPKNSCEKSIPGKNPAKRKLNRNIYLASKLRGKSQFEPLQVGQILFLL